MFTSGIDFEITPKEIMVTPTSGQSKVYGEVDSILTYSLSSGLEIGDVFTGDLSRLAGENIGDYAISQGDLNAGTNYNLLFTSGIDFRIIPKEITVTPKAGQFKVFSDIDPILVYNISPALETGDLFTGSLLRTSGENIGDYEIILGNLSAGTNYNVVITPGVNFKITTKNITIIPQLGQSKDFGEVDPVLTYTFFPALESGDVCTGNLVRAPGENIGDYAISEGDLTAGANYKLEVTSGVSFTITPATPTIDFTDVSKVYGDADFDLQALTNSDGLISYSIMGAANGTSLSGINNETVIIGNAGVVKIRATVAATTNYNSVSKDVILTINKAVLRGKANDISRIYNTPNPTFTISYSGFVNSDTVLDIDAEPIAKTIATIDSNVGEYYIVLYGGWDDNYTIETGLFSLGVLSIIQQIPVIDFSEITKTYGDPDFKLNATSGSVGEISYSIVGAANETNLSGINNAIVSIGNAGTVTIRATLAGTTNYTSITKDITLTINKAILIATADNITRPYGVENPELTISYEGFVYDDTELDIDTEPTIVTIADINSNVGEYYILLFGGSDKNYTIITGVLSPGILEIVQQTPTIDFENITKIYGDPDFNLLATVDSDIAINYSIVGEANGTVLSGIYNEIVSIGNAGTVMLRASVAETTNYTAGYKEVMLFIEKSKLKVELKDVTKEYGEEDPVFGYDVISGTLKNGEELILTREKGEDVGTYAIFPSLANSNYDITYNAAELSITKASISIVADAQSKAYGEEDPVFTCTYISGALASWDTLVFTREEGEDVGTYEIYATLDHANYNITYVGANLSITQSIITLTADSQSKIYGEEDPVLSYQVTSGTFVDGDVFEGSLIREEGEDIGIYAIYSTLSNSNYRITYISADLSIIISEITITIDNLTKDFGAMDPEFTYQVTSGNLVDSGVLMEREEGEAIGVYKISSNFTNPNYIITIVDGSLTIQEIVPIVTTLDVKEVTGTTASFEGILVSNGGVAVFEQGFIVGLSDNRLFAKDTGVLKRMVLSPADPFSTFEDKFDSETTFYYRAYAINSKGIGYGEIKMFTTLDITPPIAPIIFSAAGFTCPNNREVTSDNNFIINGISEAYSVLEIFINGESVGFATTDENGDWELDISAIDQEDGIYEFTAIATDLSYNSSVLSEVYFLRISTENSDLDNIPDFCDDDDDNDGYLDATQTQEKIGYGISPDGDGINEVFVIRDIEDYPNNELSIYSRSGAIVFKANSYDNTWSGTNMFTSGEAKLPEGSYFFVLDLKTPGKKIMQGWIYIKY